MSSLLKGNYQINKKSESESTDTEMPPSGPELPGLTEQFEKAALKRLAGSICFVRRNIFTWRDDKKTTKNASRSE